VYWNAEKGPLKEQRRKEGVVERRGGRDAEEDEREDRGEDPKTKIDSNNKVWRPEILPVQKKRGGSRRVNFCSWFFTKHLVEVGVCKKGKDPAKRKFGGNVGKKKSPWEYKFRIKSIHQQSVESTQNAFEEEELVRRKQEGSEKQKRRV
jgi:hypothetical protein